MKKILIVSCTICAMLQLNAQSATSNGTNHQVANDQSTNVNAVKDLPGYPVYINTGNVDADNATYEYAKNKWIAENPTLYKKYNSINSTSVATSDNALPGYPQFINTGNPNEDIKNYKEAKDKWITDNPELYKQYLTNLANNAVHTTIESDPNNPTQGMDKISKEQWIKENPELYYGKNNSTNTNPSNK